MTRCVCRLVTSEGPTHCRESMCVRVCVCVVRVSAHFRSTARQAIESVSWGRRRTVAFTILLVLDRSPWFRHCSRSPLRSRIPCCSPCQVAELGAPVVAAKCFQSHISWLIVFSPPPPAFLTPAAACAPGSQGASFAGPPANPAFLHHVPSHSTEQRRDACGTGCANAGPIH